MNHIHGYPHSKKAEFYKLLLDYDESLERDLADCRAIWYESGTHNLMVGDYGITDRIESMIISKNFGFIERLVKNDKIDLENYKDKSELYTLKVVHGTDYYIDLLTNKVNSGFLLMILSISDSPIDYLCSILR